MHVWGLTGASKFDDVAVAAQGVKLHDSTPSGAPQHDGRPKAIAPMDRVIKFVQHLDNDLLGNGQHGVARSLQ